MSKADLAMSKFGSSNFKYAIMSGANLEDIMASGSDFSGASFINTYMPGANLTSTDLTGANFSGANLSYANLIGATVDLTALQAAKTLSCAYMPDGTQHPSDTGGKC